MKWLPVERFDRAWLGGKLAAIPLAGVVSRGLEWMYDRAIGGAPGLDGAQEMAAAYREKHDDPEAAIDALITWQSGQAGVAGFITGLGGAVTLPFTLPAHFVSALYIQIRLIAAIAHLRGYDTGSDEVRLAAFACLSGSAAADRLKNAGVNAGAGFARQMVLRFPADVVKNVGGIGGAHLARRVGAHGGAALTKALPLVGGVVSGRFDAAATRLVGMAAKRLFPPRPAATVEPS